MRADHIIKNAKIFTADEDHPQASSLAVKDGRFVYVGDEAGLSEYEGEVTDLGGKFIMPGIIDSHVHVTFAAGFEYARPGEWVPCAGKREILDFMADYVRNNPGLKMYIFELEQKKLGGEKLTKEDLDAICPDSELLVTEAENHSLWINSKLLARHGITDDTPDPVPGLSYYVREHGHVTGNIFEGAAEMPVLLDGAVDLSDEQIDAALRRWIDFSVKNGVSGVFDAGIPGLNSFNERVYSRLREMDRQGKLPVYVDGCYVISSAREAKEGLEELKRLRREYDTEHLKVHTLKLFMDGTLKLHSGAMVTPYADTGEMGYTALNTEEVVDILKALNEEGLDFHVHTVGERASRVILDGVEQARKELGDSYHVRVTSAHLQIQDDADLSRFAELGVIANYTPWWHCEDVEMYKRLFGEKRGSNMYRCKSVWDSGALVTWSCDTIAYMDFSSWNPYLGMEVGMTRFITDKTKIANVEKADAVFPPADERMGIEEMLLGYTINGAKQLGIDARKGSIEAGKDADFLVFDNDLLTAEHEGFSHSKPDEVYYCGRRIK